MFPVESENGCRRLAFSPLEMRSTERAGGSHRVGRVWILLEMNGSPSRTDLSGSLSCFEGRQQGTPLALY